MKRLPGEREINPSPGFQGGEIAVEHFHGKSFEDACSLFREDFLCYQEDLLWMGPDAWLFYFPAAVSALRSMGGRPDLDLGEGLLSVVETKLDQELLRIRPSHALIRELCGMLIAEAERAAGQEPSALSLKLRCSVILERIK